MNSQIDKVLDCTGLLCPEPVMMLHKGMREILVGQIIQVIATDPSTQRDITKFCQFLGHELVQARESEGQYFYLIKKMV